MYLFAVLFLVFGFDLVSVLFCFFLFAVVAVVVVVVVVVVVFLLLLFIVNYYLLYYQLSQNHLYDCQHKVITVNLPS